MNFRLISLLLTLILVFSLFGCNFAKESGGASSSSSASQTESEEEKIDLSKFDAVDRSVVDFRTSLYSAVELTKGFEALKTEDQRTCYKSIEKNISYISKAKTENYYSIAPVTLKDTELSEAELHLVISAFTMDNPEVFWIHSNFSYEVSEGNITLHLTSAFSASEIKENARLMGSSIEDIFDNVSGGLSAYERELAIHDAFASVCKYADDTENMRVYTSMGALVDNYAVCEGYSRAMQILLSMAGIETYYVFGTGSEELHMWNVVNIDGEWYHLDATWNDQDYGIIYDYFNLTEEEITESHTLSPFYWELTEDEVSGGDTGVAVSFNIFVPESNGEGVSYYEKNAVTVTGFDEENLENIAQAFISALDRGEELIYLYIDPDHLVYASAVENLFSSGDYAIFESIEIANSQIYYTQIYDKSVEIDEIPEENIVAVYFEQE